MALAAALPHRGSLSCSTPRRTLRPAACAAPLRSAAPLAARSPVSTALACTVVASRAVEPRRRKVVAHAAAAQAEGKDEGAPSEAAFGLTLFFWFAFNALFAIFNKRTLNVFPHPWLLSWIQLACGAAFMVVVWAARVYPAPKVTREMLKALLPVTVLHLIGHVAGCASYNFSSVSFMQVVKAAEPVVSVLALTALYGKRFSLGVWLSLVPIVGGVAVVSATEVNFAWAGFLTAMLSNFAFVFRNILSKELQQDIGLQGINLYAWMSILGTALLLPVALAMEGGAIPSAFSAAAAAFPTSGALPFLWFGRDATFIPFLLTGGLLYHLYNQTSYMALQGISPLTYSICNTVKRVVVIVAGVAVFRNPVPLVNGVASAVAIAGTWFYSQAEAAAKKKA